MFRVKLFYQMYLKSQKTIYENIKIIFCPPNV